MSCRFCKNIGTEGDELIWFTPLGGMHKSCIQEYQRRRFQNGDVEFGTYGEEWFGFQDDECDLCCDSGFPTLRIECEIEGMSSYKLLCFDCLRLLMDWYNENVVRPKVSQMIDEILTEDTDVWRELAGC